MGVTVTAPDGREWRVSQHVAWPTRRFDPGSGLEYMDVANGADSFAAFVIITVVTVAFVLLLPFIVLAIEAVVVALLTMLAFRTWIVRATCSDGGVHEWRTRGVFRARTAVREVADELRRGVPAAPLDDARTVG